ncbi:MAG TPA: type II secretion system F family protein [Segeticoccus sp.]|uniref:type II secretion system F family protein n=1 Tax=Segeticoccus sp. TaxID=2706531 RepID=UPI002D7EFEF5|nr:type II secretion system F family protein [Segeticoccus sp.]HET8600405.1 type II secretion system F family protein [Segeticoccus sp.]
MLLRGRRHVSGGGAEEELVLLLVETMAPALRAGLAPARALQLAADPVGSTQPSTRARLEELLRAARDGEPLAPLWRDWARASAAPELAVLARAWSLSERTGAPLADGLATAADAVRAARRSRSAVAAASAGARATMNLLTALPLGGIAVAALVGVAPDQLYGSAAAQCCLVAGGLLVVFGRWWVGRLTRSALRAKAVA